MDLGIRDRVALVAALQSVDLVTWFNEDTPLGLIRAVRPEVLVKGGDYRPHQVAGRAHAGKTVILRLVPGRSTTAVVKKLRA